jgi:hypothetical protein
MMMMTSSQPSMPSIQAHSMEPHSTSSSSPNRSNSLSPSFDYFLKLYMDCLFATTAISIEVVIDPFFMHSELI